MTPPSCLPPFSVIVVDEVDSLKPGRLESMFEWPHLPHSKVLLVAIANRIDLPARHLKLLQKCKKTAVRNKLLFEAYDNTRIKAILLARVRQACGGTREAVDAGVVDALHAAFGVGAGAGPDASAGAGAGAGAGVACTPGSPPTSKKRPSRALFTDDALPTPPAAVTVFDDHAVSMIAGIVVKNGSGDARKALELASTALSVACASNPCACPPDCCGGGACVWPGALVNALHVRQANGSTLASSASDDALDSLPLAPKLVLVATFRATAVADRAPSETDVRKLYGECWAKLSQSSNACQFKDALRFAKDAGLVRISGKKAPRVALDVAGDRVEAAFSGQLFWLS